VNLTKTDYLRYLETPMHLWAEKHSWLDEVFPSRYDQHLMAQGKHVEKLARDFLVRRLDAGGQAVKLEFQKTIADEPYLARLDAVVYDPAEDCWDIYEIKSASSVKKEHLIDAAFQRLIAEAKFNLRHTFLLHINREYQRTGDFELEAFFTIVNVDEQTAALRQEVLAGRAAAWETANRDSPDGVEDCLKPAGCPCPRLCHPELPKYSIYDIPRLGKAKARQLKDAGILAIEDIPPDFPLSEKQRAVAETARVGQPRIDKAAIRAALDQLEYPLYFLDYETYNPAVPIYDGYRPYQHMVFQYSLDVYPTPDSPPQHFEFLATQRGDPGLPLTEHLLENIGERGSVIVWYQPFESSRNRELAEHFPQYAVELENINNRIFDLMEIFSKGSFLHPDFHGSASIKNVLPVLAENLTYEDLEISQGDEAMIAWVELMEDETTPERREELTRNLLAYCARDTRAMVENWKTLLRLI
jgi:hypothetical protein